MHRLILTFLVLLITGCSSAPTGRQGEAPKELFLLMGQSNMAGRGKVEPQDRTPHPRVWVLNEANAWAPAVDPLHFDRPDRVGVGPGLAFGKAMAQSRPGARIGLVPCAVGGTPLERWEKGGDLYENALVRARLAQREGRLRGVIWHQGESDSQSAETAASYGRRLQQMIRDLRSDLQAPDLPVVVGELGAFLPQRYAHFAVVNAALRALPGQVRNTAFVSADGLGHGGDSVHFDAAAGREFGRRYAEAMQRLLSR